MLEVKRVPGALLSNMPSVGLEAKDVIGIGIPRLSGSSPGVLGQVHRLAFWCKHSLSSIHFLPLHRHVSSITTQYWNAKLSGSVS